MTSLQKKLESALYSGYTKNRTESINSFEGGIFMWKTKKTMAGLLAAITGGNFGFAGGAS